MKETLQFPAGAEGWALRLDRRARHAASHRHDELEVNLVLTGRASYLFGHRKVPLAANSMIWLFPAQEHLLIDWSPDFSMWVVVFRSSLLRRHARTGTRRVLRKADPGDIFSRRIEAARTDLLHHVYEDAASGEAPECVNAALAYALTASWRSYQAADEPLLRLDVHPAVARAARLIAAGNEPRDSPRLAKAAGLSPARLSRLFKRQTGVSLALFRQRHCLERFLNLYRRGARYTLIEAALEAGFGSYAQFHRVFTSRMRMSPAAYRHSLTPAVVASK